MRILVVTSNLYPEIGGPFNVITSTVRQLQKKKINISIYPFFDGKKKSTSKIYSLIKRYDIIHFYGGWDKNHILISLICFILKKKYIISPMGIFEDWSLNQKKFKKMLALKVYQKKILNLCNAIHATSELEKKNIQKLTKNKDIVTIPHGIEELESKFIKDKFFINKKKRALFFSRIHKKKGVYELLEVWKKLGLSDWELHIYGPDFDKLFDNLPSNLKKIDSVFYKGPIYNEQRKKEIFKYSDVMILPTKSENFGYVILESLRSGLPVITTNKTPWEIIQTTKSGWIINDKINDLENILKELNTISKEEFLKKSQNSLELSKNFFWDKIIDKYIYLYSNL